MSTATTTRTVLGPLEDRIGEMEDLVKAGIIDPAKVTRAALQNAASVAAPVLTTDVLVAERPEKKPATPSPGMEDF